VAVFSESGKLEASKTLIGGAAPWGVALAPSDFGQFSNDLLVGNFSYHHSEILASIPSRGRSKAQSASTPARATQPAASGH
jgi:hypothetical protein